MRLFALRSTVGRARTSPHARRAAGLLGVATALVALSPNIAALYVSRVVAGFCAGTFGPVAFGWVTERYTAATRANAVAVVGAGLTESGTIGQLVVAALGAHDWRTPFWLFERI